MHVGQRQAREALQVAQCSRLGGAGRWGGAVLGAFKVHSMRISGAFQVRSRRRRPEKLWFRLGVGGQIESFALRDPAPILSQLSGLHGGVVTVMVGGGGGGMLKKNYLVPKPQPREV